MAPLYLQNENVWTAFTESSARHKTVNSTICVDEQTKYFLNCLVEKLHVPLSDCYTLFFKICVSSGD